MIRTYSELIKLKTFNERFEYLKLNGNIGDSTFGYSRYLNQALYASLEWKTARNKVIIRDNGCDLGVDGYNIYGRIIIHHMNPITIEDIKEHNPDIYNPDYLVAVSHDTHNAIHYGSESILPVIIERSPNDTKLW